MFLQFTLTPFLPLHIPEFCIYKSTALILYIQIVGPFFVYTISPVRLYIQKMATGTYIQRDLFVYTLWWSRCIYTIDFRNERSFPGSYISHSYARRNEGALRWSPRCSRFWLWPHLYQPVAPSQRKLLKCEHIHFWTRPGAELSTADLPGLIYIERPLYRLPGLWS